MGRLPFPLKYLQCVQLRRFRWWRFSSEASLRMPKGLRPAMVENPTTGTNWEALGVAPDVPTPAALARQVALKTLGVSSDRTEIADLSKARLF
jgi:hypothetical protein